MIGGWAINIIGRISGSGMKAQKVDPGVQSGGSGAGGQALLS
jgi:hypothetical protein